MKKIIFIGGTSRSGSTLLDKILANDPKAMSLGEIIAIFHPTREHHFEVISKLKESKIWRSILKGGKTNLFPNLIKFFPEIDIFIDSSKDPFWFRYHQNSKKENYSIYNILIHKTPFELANSFIKRDKYTEWIRAYISYHRKYFTLIDGFISITYKDVVKNVSYLKKLCEFLEIDYFEGKMNYWEKEQITFFGSNSVKSSDAHKVKKQLISQERNEIKYDGVKGNENYIKKCIVNNPQITVIENELKINDLFFKIKVVSHKKMRYNEFYLSLFLMKRHLKHYYHYYFPQKYF